ncbi:MAG: hypothetical protein QNJ41_29415 [Xenococcaceae cyanobacterium MO_188.B32]|nr:hypothetical protein [Xenococcaceae cyanobacterium MO_188.B32]
MNFIALSTCIASIVLLQNNSLKKSEIIQDKDIYLKEQEQFSSIAKIRKKLPSFGFNNLIADLTFLQFVQYFGDGEARQITGYSTVTDYFEDIVNRDPNFIQSHLVMSAANSLFTGRPEKTVDLMNQALETVNPQAPNYPFLLWTYKAADETLFLGDLKAAKNSYEMAAKWARWRKDDLGNEMAGRYDKTARFLASDPDPTQAQFGAWMSILSGTQDRKTQNYILDKLKDLGAEITIDSDGKLKVKPPRKA